MNKMNNSETNRKRTWCKLTGPVVTEEGDLILSGTTVQVLCWDIDSVVKGGNLAKTSRVLCRTTAYLYVDETPADKDDNNWSDWDGNVGEGLIFSTQACNLQFESLITF